ncbi:MAG: Fic family protein [Thermoanaerobaculia bacterium]
MGPFSPPRLPLSLPWEALVPAIGRASAAIARYDALLHGLVNPDILVTPLRNREAVLSSRIEGTQGTLQEVLEQEADPAAPATARTSDIREILNYRSATVEAVAALRDRPLSLNLIRNIHATLMAGVRGHDRARGEFRRVQNWIGPPGCTLDGATYVPPPPDRLMPLLDNLERYIHTEEKDPLVQLALVHAQFELIHPFLDGNGRTGRILIPLFLYEKHLLTTPAFYLSGQLEAHRERYYEGLRRVSEAADYLGWILFFLSSVVEQADADMRRIRKMTELYDEMKGELASGTRSQYVIKMLDTIFSLPIFSTPQFVETSRIPNASANRLLKLAESEGLLEVRRPGRGRRPTIWAFPALLEVVRD